MKTYIKPEMVTLELRAEERFAGSNNCAAQAGWGNGCTPASIPSNDNGNNGNPSQE